MSNTSLVAQIRRSPSSGHILAATTSQLVSQITSPNLLDYELLSDFFLTFRMFTTTHELVTRLIDRLAQSFKTTNDFGRITRVRAFVALRHWVLNYFVDDFLSDCVLRTQFCRLVNKLCNDLLQDEKNRQGDLKILTELKKCWKHTCALYWDMPDAYTEGEPGDDIFPGGQVGSRASRMDSASHLTIGSKNFDSRLNLSVSPLIKPVPDAKLHAISNYSLNATEKLDPAALDDMERRHDAALRQSDQSAQVFSCAFPASFWVSDRTRTRALPNSRPIPVAMQTQGNSAEQSGQQTRKRHHNRSGSFSDALRDDRAPLPVPKATESESQFSYPIAFPGALIRGALFTPTSPHVESLAPSSPVDENSSFDFSSVDDDDSCDLDNDRPAAPATPNSPSVKRFIGSVRRALSTRQYPPRVLYDLGQPHDRVTTSGSGGRPSPATSQRSRGPPKRKLVQGRAQVRIDMLAAEVSEAFDKAVQEMVEAHHQGPNEDETDQGHHRAHSSHSMPLIRADQSQPACTKVNSNVTMGSRSILIVDDTAAGHLSVPDTQPADKMDSFTAEEITALGSPGESEARIADTAQVQTVPIFLDSPTSPTTNFARTPTVAYAPSETSFRPDSHLVNITNATEDTKASGQPADTISEVLDSQTLKHSSEPTGTGQTSTHQSLSAPGTMSEVSQTSTNDPFNLDRPAANQLRRRPGGDLRAVDHVHDLDEDFESQPSATNSTQTPQVAIPPRKSSVNATQVLGNIDEMSEKNEEKGGGTETGASQPVMNPSFEFEVAKLADLPDNESEIGIDAALRKLEGRVVVDDSTPVLQTPVSSQDVQRPTPEAADGQQTPKAVHVRRQRRGGEVVEAAEQGELQIQLQAAMAPQVLDVREDAASVSTPHASPKLRIVLQSNTVSAAVSEESYNSIPLLERGTSHPPKAKRLSSEWLHVPRPENQKQACEGGSNGDAVEGQQSNSEQSLEVIEKSESLLRVEGTQSRGAASSNTHKSFLLDDDQSLSGLSSDTADAFPDDGSQAMHSFYDDDEGSLTQETHTGHLEGLQATLPQRSRGPSLSVSDSSSEVASEIGSESDSPSTPIAEPRDPPPENVAAGPSIRPDHLAHDQIARSQSADNIANISSPRPRPANAPTPTHLPHVLAYDSLILAQQFSLIEKDAMAEIEWRDLIDLRWNQAPPKLNSWVDYLKTLGRHPQHQSIRGGVDLCIARFNIMVKWVRSEIVLTQDTHERAATIIKYIHIAQHARTLRNWATMYQITMALIGADCSRLRNTWALVSDRDRDTLKGLETLIMPTRNFHNLREEMETATADTAKSGGDGGCIPFIGIYTHDLIYNAQKPPWLNAPIGSRDPSPLVNFDRYHTAAMIVKNLLRLIEASSKYAFNPIPEVASRCLWVGSLNDEEITRRSRELEPVDEQRSSR